MAMTPMIRAHVVDSALNDARDILDNVLPVYITAQILASPGMADEMRAELLKVQKHIADALATLPRK